MEGVRETCKRGTQTEMWLSSTDPRISNPPHIDWDSEINPGSHPAGSTPHLLGNVGWSCNPPGARSGGRRNSDGVFLPMAIANQDLTICFNPGWVSQKSAWKKVLRFGWKSGDCAVDASFGILGAVPWVGR